MILRIVLWLMPAIFIPISFVVIGFFMDILYSDTAIHLALSLPVIPTLFIGYLDQRISFMVKRIPPPHSKKEQIRRTVIFVLAQLLIAPAVCWMVLYGYCMVAESL